MTTKITIPYFPRAWHYTAPIELAAIVYLFVHDHPIWATLVAFLLGIIVTTKYVTEIDLDAKKYKDYLSLLWIPLNVEAKTFNSVDRIVVTKGNHAQTINTRVQSRQMNWSDYTGTLILDNDTLDLVTAGSKKDLIVKLKPFATFLKVGVEDITTSEHYWVDLDGV